MFSLAFTISIAKIIDEQIDEQIVHFREGRGVSKIS